jgi:hypothetical protein
MLHFPLQVEHLARCAREVQQIHGQCLSCLFDFKQNWDLPTDCYGQTDRHGDANMRILELRTRQRVKLGDNNPGESDSCSSDKKEFPHFI